jgi:hypothetical protein
MTSRTQAQKALEILQGKQDGDGYGAANILASRMNIEMNADEGSELTDWLAEGDFDGDETMESLIAEWKELD